MFANHIICDTCLLHAITIFLVGVPNNDYNFYRRNSWKGIKVNSYFCKGNYSIIFNTWTNSILRK
jgi:hypothetical protein